MSSEPRQGSSAVERTPLLPSFLADELPKIQADSETATPLPLLQLIILGLVRLAEPIAYTQIFPYVNDMTEHSHVTDDPSQIGFYSGLLDSTFAIVQLVTIFYWGTLSDRIGRKPVILVGLTGCALSTVLFGFSSGSFWWAVAMRALAGAFSGNSAVMNSAVSEITDASNIGRAFPLFSAFYVIGMFLGPLLGGSLAYSWQHISLFWTYPYLAPCLVSALITMASILIGVVWMKETLPNKLKAADSARTYLSNPNPDSVIAIPPKVTTGAPSPSTFSELISSSIVRRILLAIFSQNVVAMGFEVIFALFAYTPLELGGLGRNPAEIGVSLAAAAILGSILTVIAIPPLQKWTKDDVKLYTYCMCGWVLVYLIPPAMMAIGYATGGKQHSTGFVWTTMVLMLVVARACGMGWSMGQILLKNSALGPDTLGAIFGLGQMVGCIGRAIGPALTSSLFAASVGQQLLGGQLVWYIMCAISIFGAWLASRVIDAKNN